MKLFDFKCSGCGKVYEELADSPDERPPCPSCGEPGTWHICGGNTDTFQQNMFPYFDRGLGCEVTSKEHRAALCREKGVVPVDGDYDARQDLGVGADERLAEQQIAAYDRYVAESMEHPFVREWMDRRQQALERMR